MFRNQILTAAVDQAVFGKVKPAVTMAEEKALPTDWLVMLPTDGERDVALKLMKDWICSSEICLPTYMYISFTKTGCVGSTAHPRTVENMFSF